MQQAVSQSPWFVPLIGLIGVLAGALIGFGGTIITQRQQSKRDHVADERSLRDAKRKRREDAYRHLIEQLHLMFDFMDQFPVSAQEQLSPNDGEEQIATSRALQRNINESFALVALEFGPESPAFAIYQAAEDAFVKFTRNIIKSQQGEKGTQLHSGTQKDLLVALQQLIRVAQEDLETYEQALPASRPRRRK